MSPRRSVLLVAILATVCLGVVSPAAAQSNASNVSTADSLDDAGVDLTLEELRRGGQSFDNNPDSVRIDSRMWWLIHWPAGSVLGNPGELMDTSSEFVSRGSTVDRNAVYLRTSARKNPPSDPKELKIVYWREGTRERMGSGGATVEEPAARDVIVDTHEITLYPGMNIHKIPLRNSDSPRKVSMWFTDNPELRWTFEHDSVPTTTDANINSEGQYIWSIFTDFGLWLLLGSVVVGSGARKAIEKTGIGPGYPLGMWLIGIAVATGLALWWFFKEIAIVLAWAPQIIAGLLVLFVGIVVLESQAVGDRDVAFIQPTTRSVDGPDDSEGADALIASAQVERVVDMPTGTPAVVKPGILGFLARWRGAAARVSGMAFETSIKTPTGPWSEIVVVDPDADTVLEYEAEGWRLDGLELDSRDDYVNTEILAAVIAAVSAAVWLHVSPLWGVGLAAVATLALLAEPVDGKAEVTPASAHVRAAWISTMTLSQSVDDAHTLDSARESLVELQSETQQEIQRVVEKQDATLVESALGMDVDRGVDDHSGEDGDDADLDDVLARIDQIDGSHDPEEEPADD